MFDVLEPTAREERGRDPDDGATAPGDGAGSCRSTRTPSTRSHVPSRAPRAAASSATTNWPSESIWRIQSAACDIEPPDDRRARARRFGRPAARAARTLVREPLEDRGVSSVEASSTTITSNCVATAGSRARGRGRAARWSRLVVDGNDDGEIHGVLHRRSRTRPCATRGAAPRGRVAIASRASSRRQVSSGAPAALIACRASGAEAERLSSPLRPVSASLAVSERVRLRDARRRCTSSSRSLRLQLRRASRSAPARHADVAS